MFAREEKVEGGRGDNDLYTQRQRIALAIGGEVRQRSGNCINVPVLGSSFALFKFSKMSLMDLIVPFL